MTVKDRVEEAVEALPPEYQQRMARLVLAGWNFYPPMQRNTQLWNAWHSEKAPATALDRLRAVADGKDYRSSSTLYTLLEKMVDEDDHS